MPFLNKLIRILIVDDDEDDFFITSDYIKEIENGHFQIDWANQYTKALENMCSGTYDVYFVDYRLGAKTGIDLLREAVTTNCEAPIILLTGKGNREIDREAMRLGAFDYLVKTDLNTEKLERTIRYALERSANIKAIKKNEQKFRNIFEQSMDAVFITDMQLRFLDLNPAAIEMLGLNREAFTQYALTDFMENESLATHFRILLQSGNDVNDKEIEIKTAEDENRSCIFSASVETDMEGRKYIQGILHDISNLKKAEWLTLQTEKLAAAGRLVRTLAHEVRNPLNNISLSADQLLQEMKDEEGLLYLDVIRRNSARISTIITELLNSSRPSEIELDKTGLQELLQEVIDQAADSLQLKNVELVVDFQPSTFYVLADKSKLKIAFMNLVVNAIEAMETTEKSRLIVRLFSQENQAICEITDNGCGITAENLSRLFEPYYTSKRNGMGLGLASTMNIIQSHKGYIEVYSKPDQGTSFIVHLPLEETSKMPCT
ncbi:hybrid sensor histidine kinase/response regulator [Flavihumibacter sp. UBA7668]|uniref:hybrid sensor histidine kinase/response regulator n=1 Tax=Flavihumibacter sp. UBA7668 TaxID=1946542 RepID=UPI0025B8FD17|nr:hybrid sensor histidine kinase/response regulator [Flavihumibacter sp. UBA7668]